MESTKKSLPEIVGKSQTADPEPLLDQSDMIMRMFSVRVENEEGGIVFVGPPAVLAATNFQWFIKSIMSPSCVATCKRTALASSNDFGRLGEVSKAAGVLINFDATSEVLTIYACEEAMKNFLSKKNSFFTFELEYHSVSGGKWSTFLELYTTVLKKEIFKKELINVSLPSGVLVCINMDRMVITDSETFSRNIRVLIGVANSLPMIEEPISPPINPIPEPDRHPQPLDIQGPLCLFHQFPNLRGQVFRGVMLDGCNIGYAHGYSKVMSMKGIKVVVDFFQSAGIRVQATIPSWRLDPNARDRNGRPGMYDPDNVVPELLRDRNLVPLAKGYEDHFVVDLARKENCVIITADGYKDLKQPELRDYIKMFSFNFAIRGDVFFVNRRNAIQYFEKAIIRA